MSRPGVTVGRWTSAEPIGLAAVEAMLSPRCAYRVSTVTLSPGREVAGLARACTWYMAAGRLRYRSGSSEVELCAGDVAAIPEERYSIVNTGDSDAVYVAVWELPPEFRQA